VLEPGESFDNTSGCTLPTPYGSMRGTYQMVNDRQEQFDVEIPTFALAEPFSNGMTVH
jgi:ApaG protein